MLKVSQKKRIVVRIQDNGIGFMSELSDRIFAADYVSIKKQKTYDDSSFSSGFKLHACANYLIANGGSICAHSEGEDKGAVFTIKLPVKPENTL
ncbi:MAG: ATP-binding protein [Gammaproteobacteria bacterium]|nr:ATP-binding protein [Gammaproteobacteria bacterium]